MYLKLNSLPPNYRSFNWGMVASNKCRIDNPVFCGGVRNDRRSQRLNTIAIYGEMNGPNIQLARALQNLSGAVGQQTKTFQINQKINTLKFPYKEAAYAVFLPGNFEVLVSILARAGDIWFDSGNHSIAKQIVLLDSNGFYKPWLALIQYIIDSRSYPQDDSGDVQNPPIKATIFKVAKTPEEALAYVNNSKVEWTQIEHTANFTLTNALHRLMKTIQNGVYAKRHPKQYGIALYGSGGVGITPQELEMAQELGRQIVLKRFKNDALHVVTGGGTGIMREAGKAAIEQGGHAVGIWHSNLDRLQFRKSKDVLPEYREYRHVTDLLEGFQKRSTRAIFLPGGFGTLEEMLRTAADIWFNPKSRDAQKQIVLLDPNGFYKPVVQYLGQMLQNCGYSDTQIKNWLQIFKFTSSVEEALDTVFPSPTSNAFQKRKPVKQQ